MITLVSEEKYTDGQAVFKECSSGDWVYVLISGSIEISKVINGKKIILEILQRGEIFGELAFLGSTRRTATATAIGDTIVGIFDRDSLDSVFNKLSSDFRSILITLVKRFEKMNNRITQYSSREETRIKKRLSVSYKHKQSFLKAYTENISGGGLFIKTDNPLERGEKILLSLQLPDLGDPLNIDCVVAWCEKEENPDRKRPPGMGIQFQKMNKTDIDLLQNYIKKVCSD